MATAKIPGGLYYVNDVGVDAMGVPRENAPEKPKDTPNRLQPGVGLIGLTPEERLAFIVAKAVHEKPPKPTTPEPPAEEVGEGEEEEEGMPRLADLADAISDKDLAEVRAMKRKDPRAGAERIYQARIDELKG